MNYDIFNGDADGIIALLQLRLADPVDAQLITGVKRDIKLVEKVDVQAGDELTVLDISMEKNMAGLEQALAQGAHVFYADHHKAGDIPQHGNLDAHIDLDANMCTALIVDKLLDGRFHDWAITAAYGDNMIAKADELANNAGLSQQQKEQLKELGTLINYNGYGSKVEDLHFHPAELYRALLKYMSPFEAIEDTASPYYQLQSAYQQDMEAALAVPAMHESGKLKLFELPNTAASRRISGVYGNWLANQNPDSAHVVLTENADGTYTVSLRAPLNNKQGAVAVCGQFPTGGGREAAAGINALSKDDVHAFIDAVETYYA
ncbi:DHH family phosphoesterase [Vibrio alginolyticus]|uniref:DHH family phosphoesterase n=1 Tax=Vibrio alginolyticus TaxID=663 RepID=UPI001427FC3B|nr:DHH family phosphoesterase [Vibrio alginolyticus]EJX1246581.1 DHH family phosphoesterase [Vibrio alginolyticus]ELA7190780.1 DHH family phosphoesterase [Vibrio alginolyticus]ELB2759423.1 DHH family phosphoesterase [Vibrio alginolyticus]QIR93941.1 DHH family phosphoesterase [Vibrio alginolyticus]